MTNHLLFYVALSLTLVHEMDAVRCKEWSIFPGLSLLKNEAGYYVYMLAHIPLYFFLFIALTGNQPMAGLIAGLDVFFIAHLFVHLLFLKNRKNRFKNWFTWSLITGAAVFGLLDLFF
jgi:hypothetical protein